MTQHAQTLYTEHPACRVCWISQIQYCRIGKPPYHEFVILRVHHPDQEYPVGYMVVDRDYGDKVSTSTIPYLWDLRNPQIRPFTCHDLSELNDLLCEPSIQSLSPASFSGNVRPWNPPRPNPVVERFIVLNPSNVNWFTQRQYTVLAEITIEPDMIPLGCFLAAALVLTDATPEYLSLKTQHDHFALLFCRLLLGKELWSSVEDKILEPIEKYHKTEKHSEDTVEDWATKLQQTYEEKLLYVSCLRTYEERYEETARSAEGTTRSAEYNARLEQDNARLAKYVASLEEDTAGLKAKTDKVEAETQRVRERLTPEMLMSSTTTVQVSTIVPYTPFHIF